jgi:hypothetical protein
LRSLDELAALDDGEEALLGTSDQGDVLDRVAVDEDQVGDGSFLGSVSPTVFPASGLVGLGGREPVAEDIRCL